MGIQNSEYKIKPDYHRPWDCENCGYGDLVFIGLGEYKCPKCGHINLDDYGKVRDYLDENPGATVNATSMATGVSKMSITTMLRDERLEIREGSATFLKCRSCGAPINSGYYCHTCAKLAEAADRKKREKEKAEERMENIHGISAAIEDTDGKMRFRRD
ncbi:MAG: hypothetical protein J6O55_01070 [Lachnospiraceae bacterium]|nr:hypothetical protein [Lachnospiraceae bacterium]